MIFKWISERSQSDTEESQRECRILLEFDARLRSVWSKGQNQGSQVKTLENTAQHHPKWWCHEIFSTNQRKIKGKCRIQTLSLFFAPWAYEKKETERSQLFLGIQVFALTRMGGACALDQCYRGRSPKRMHRSTLNPQRIQVKREEFESELRGTRQREGSRRLTVVRGVSQRDPKSDLHRCHS